MTPRQEAESDRRFSEALRYLLGRRWTDDQAEYLKRVIDQGRG
jgi:hypothetical protein